MAKYSVNTVGELIGGKFLQHGKVSESISYLLIDSRKVTNGKQACFFALKGINRDGHEHINEAYNKGVRCFVVDQTCCLLN